MPPRADDSHTPALPPPTVLWRRRDFLLELWLGNFRQMSRIYRGVLRTMRQELRSRQAEWRRMQDEWDIERSEAEAEMRRMEEWANARAIADVPTLVMSPPPLFTIEDEVNEHPTEYPGSHEDQMVSTETDKLDTVSSIDKIDENSLENESVISDAIELAADEHDSHPIEFKVYSRRWVILAAVALMNSSIIFSWISFAPVANHVNTFYGDQISSWFSMVYMICTIAAGFFAIGAERRFTLRSTMLIAGMSNAIGGFLRFLSAFQIEFKLAVVITGQAIAAVGYPFTMILPIKVAGSWFPDNQRVLATTVGIMSNPLGVLLANIISPQLVQAPQHVPFLNGITLICAITTLLFVAFAVNRSEPKDALTRSVSQEQIDFLPGLNVCLNNKNFLIILLIMGGGIGMFNCLCTVMQSLLCASGYSNSFSGMCIALMIIGGVVAATVSGVFVDRSKNDVEILKIAAALAVVIGLAFLQLTLRSNIEYLIIPTCSLFGIIGLATYKVGLEMSTEWAFSVSKATSTGFIVLSGQIQSVIYLLVMTIFARPLDEEREKVQVCSISAEDSINIGTDSTLAVKIFSVLVIALALILFVISKSNLNRLEGENKAKNNTDCVIVAEDHKLVLLDQNKETFPLNRKIYFS